MSTESFQNLVEIVFFFFFFMDTVTLPTPKKKMEIGISAQIMQGNLDHQGATEK